MLPHARNGSVTASAISRKAVAMATSTSAWPDTWHRGTTTYATGAWATPPVIALWYPHVGAPSTVIVQPGGRPGPFALAGNESGMKKTYSVLAVTGAGSFDPPSFMVLVPGWLLSRMNRAKVS